MLETSYLLGATKNFFATFDYQFADHPGHNAAHGTVSVGGVRTHFEF